MKPHDDIIKQLNDQDIQYELLQDGFSHEKERDLSKVVKKWTHKFIGTRTAPSLDYYMWHIFSFNVTENVEGQIATDELVRQFDADTLIFNERQQYLIKCIRRIPIIQMLHFTDDIYLSHR